MKTMLVTGGCGFIGSHWIRHILTNYPDINIFNIDKLTYSGNPENLADVTEKFPTRYKAFLGKDVTDQVFVEAVFKVHRPEYVINFAAETHVDRSIHIGAKEFIDTNVYGVFVLLEAIKKFGVKMFLQVSTDEVYGSLSIGSEGKFTEETQYAPNVPYSASKASGDMFCRAYHFTWPDKVPVIVTHCSNNYGPNQYPEKLIPFFTLRALADQPLPLYGDGLNIRDWIYVMDHVFALEAVLFKGRPGEIYNIGADNQQSNIAIATMILDYLDKPHSLIRYVADRPGHDRRYAIDATKIKKELGWSPRYNFDMLYSTIGWYMKNSDWVKRVQEKTGIINPHIDLWKKM